MQLKIELLSDLCTYSGETYNSLVDIDVVHDSYGLPYIPAKRLKGCIREAYLELVEFGAAPARWYEKLFGKEGSQASEFTISNAYVENYRQICEDLDSTPDPILTHPQNVLALYTYMRTQTAMDYESGVAEENSLRTMRVVNRGIHFEAKIHVNENVTAEEAQSLLQAAQMVTHMGQGRTRGLGLVRITVDEQEQAERIHVAESQISDRNLLHYRVYLQSPMLCKSAEGNAARSQNFIEGSKILGMIAGAMGNEAFQKMMTAQSMGQGNELIVSNAYIEQAGQRCLPVSASLQKVKDQTFNEKDEMEVYDMLTAAGVTLQLTPTGFTYAAEDGTVKGVETEIHYHHRRPNDKSIGHADGTDDSAFYQLESICRGQAFRGFIAADKEQAKQIIEAFGNMKNLRMGHGRNAEYGAVKLEVDRIEAIGQAAETKLMSDFVIRLNAPAILYNETGMVTSDVAVLRDHVAEILGYEDLELKSCFLKYETIGGFNVTWGRRKPVFTALGKGTVCLFHAEQPVDVSKLAHCFLGERVNEGFGEISVLEVPRERVILKKAETAEKTGENTDQSGIIAKLRYAQALRALEEQARRQADTKRSFFAKEDSNAVIGRLILVSKEQSTYKEMDQQVEQWTSESKKKIAAAAMKDIGKVMCQREDCVPEEDAYQKVTAAYLQQVKYQFRTDKNTKGENADGES